jgi:hypothetical protein
MAEICRTYNTPSRDQNAYILDRKPEVKKPPGRSKPRWNDNIKLFLKEI